MGYFTIEDEAECLQHHGIRGQKWGIRRFQRPDGTRTAAGKARERGDKGSVEKLYSTRDVLRSKRARYNQNNVEAAVKSASLLIPRHRAQAKEDLKELKEERNRLPGEIKEARKEHNEAIKEFAGATKEKLANVDKKKVATGLAIAGTVALGAALIANPGTRNVLAKYGKTALYNVGNAAGKASNFAEKTGKRIAGRMDKAADTMIDAALVSVGGIAVTKLADKLATDEDASEGEKNAKKIAFDAAKAGIEAATGSSTSNNNSSNNKGGNLGKEVTDKIGAPSKKGVDKQSAEYQNLFKDSNGNQRDPDTRATIKSMVNAGYDIDQIDKWLNHADISDWIHASEFGSFIV